MSVYILGCLLSIAFAWLDTQKKLKRRVCVLLSALPLFFLAAFRYGIGTDYFSYIKLYDLYFSQGHQGRVEPFYFLINRGMGLLHMDAQWIFVICSAIFVFLVYFSIFDESPNPMLSIFLLVTMTYYFAFFNTMRQLTGMAFLLFSLRYVEKKKLLPFFVCVLFAAGFHYTCLLFLIVYGFAYIKITPKIAAILTVFFFTMKTPLVNLVHWLLQRTPYAMYLVPKVELSKESVLGILIQLVIFLFAVWMYQDEIRYRILFSIQMITLWLTILGGNIAQINRIKWIFGLSSILLLPMAVGQIKEKKLRIAMTAAIVLCFTVYAYIVIVVYESYMVIPYRSIFQKGAV